MKPLLEGLRVLDFGRYIAGPYCAALLADLGADVIRIERTGGGEDRALLPVTENGDGALFLQMARNKRSLALEPTSPEGREIVKKLVATADVVVANLPPRALEAMGLDDDALRAVKPDIILATTTAFGIKGPYGDRVGFDGVGQAMSGAMHMTGHANEPMRAAVAYVDFATALHSAFGVLAALMARRDTGAGQQVNTSLLGTALTLNNTILIEQALIEPDRIATGNRGQASAPSDVFHTTDGWMIVQSVGQPMFNRWVRLMEEPHWLEDPRFADDISRGKHGEVVSERMARWCAERTTEQCLEELKGARIPCGPALAPRQTLENPQVVAGGFLHLVEGPNLPAPAPIARTPLELSGTLLKTPGPAPALGEHTAAILGELGYGPEDIAALRDKGVIQG
ncbi:MAG: CoA transferase [bacterium]